MSETDFRASKGKLNSRNRYLRADASGFAITAGKTIKIGLVSMTDGAGVGAVMLDWRYSVDGLTFYRSQSPFATGHPPWSWTPVSFTADVIQVDA